MQSASGTAWVHAILLGVHVRKHMLKPYANLTLDGNDIALPQMLKISCIAADCL